MPLPLFDCFKPQDAYICLKQKLKQDSEAGLFYVRGLNASSGALCASQLLLDSVDGGFYLCIEPDMESAVHTYGDFTALLNDSEVLFLPASHKDNRSRSTIDASFLVQRTIALKALQNYKSKTRLVLVAYPQALEESVPKSFESNSMAIHTGDKLSHSFIKEFLGQYGFQKTDYVSEPGDYAVRGSIIDVFSFADNHPYRISFFGDQVESLRIFDANTQNSIEKRGSIDIVPKMYSQQGDMLFEHLPKDAFIWMKDCNAVREAFLEESKETFDSLHTKYKVISLAKPSYCKDVEVLEKSFDTVPQPIFHKKFDLLAADLKQKQELGYSCFFVSDNPAQIQRLSDIFSAQSATSHLFTGLNISLTEGFVDHGGKFCVYTDHQIFERYHRVRMRRAVEKSERLTIQDLTDFKLGDYVVHIDYGVGVFGGLVKMTNNGKEQEMIRITYAENDTLLVNIHGLHRISRFKSKDGNPPVIRRLSSKAWRNLKTQTKSKLKDIAQELIKLYASRKASQGFAFSGDTCLQHELEASFMFEDTPDQLKATMDVKEDMEKPYPMDRLICGDVGFGKTEVAIRAAFKAVMDGKQVAVLVPTTILALQHYQTFKERLKDFGPRINYICRLKTSAEINTSLDALKKGNIDIIVGTHRLLNKNVEFKDLGLLIIDEEQKFGVGAKEKLRQMKTNVDTLTMTATPIPRTLQFSLMGARDLSFIQTPPPNRLPVHTEVLNFDEDQIKDAIDYEIGRGGQVFFVHNRVEDIQSIADIIRSLCPNARIAVGHGQMPPKVLEKIVMDFIYGDYDVLLATTIIENGIDIPNANTIIINQAHMFGLSDLHQMRGRVGRSNRKAYCYLLVPPMTSISEDAKRRLKAIETFQELGSGFNIAMQDLDIRGAGNMLGAEQSGFISEMGFETYQRILNEAFEEINASLPEEEQRHDTDSGFVSDCNIETDLEVLIPDWYISQIPEKMRLYKALNDMRDESGLKPFFDSMEDRFGPVPEQAKQLGFVVRLRKLAQRLGFERIVLKNGIMLAYFIQNQTSSYYKTPVFAYIMQYIQLHPLHLSVKEQNEKLYLRMEKVESIETAYKLLINLVKP